MTPGVQPLLLDQRLTGTLVHHTEHSLDEITADSVVPFGIVKRWAPAMLLIALTCAFKSTPAQIESRAPTTASTQSSERFLIIAVDNDAAPFLVHAGSTPGGYEILTPYGSTSQARHVMRSLEHKYGLREVSAWPIEPLHMHCAALQIPAGADRESLLAKLSRDPRIKLAQPLQTFATRGEDSNDPEVRSAQELAIYPH